MSKNQLPKVGLLGSGSLSAPLYKPKNPRPSNLGTALHKAPKKGAKNNGFQNLRKYRKRNRTPMDLRDIFIYL